MRLLRPWGRGPDCINWVLIGTNTFMIYCNRRSTCNLQIIMVMPCYAFTRSCDFVKFGEIQGVMTPLKASGTNREIGIRRIDLLLSKQRYEGAEP
jgi:hypothetical protein